MPPSHQTVKTIASRQNSGFRLLRSIVSSSRARRDHQAAWIEGERLCLSFFDADLTQLPILVMRASLPSDAIHPSIHRRCQEVWSLDPALYREISQVESPTGWGLLIPKLRFKPPPSGGDVVILDRVQDPGNVGSILRSSAAAGAQAVWCLSGTADPWSPKVLRSAMGAHFNLQIRDELTGPEALAAARDEGLPLLVTRLGADAGSLFDPLLPLSRPVAWLFGQEGSGVAAEFLSQARGVQIPQQASIESLNVAAAAAVCLFESRRRKTLTASRGESSAPA